MLKRLTTTLAAASIAITGAAAPAAAETDEELLGKILAGAAILGIGAAIIDKRKDRARERERRRKAEVARHRSDNINSGRGWLGDGGGRRIIEGEVRGQWSRAPRIKRGVKRLSLPVRCRVIVDTPRGDRLGYSSRCLDRRFEAARHLPRRCEVLVNTSDGLRAVYGERCLDRDGWRTPSRRN